MHHCMLRRASGRAVRGKSSLAQAVTDARPERAAKSGGKQPPTTLTSPSQSQMPLNAIRQRRDPDTPAVPPPPGCRFAMNTEVEKLQLRALARSGSRRGTSPMTNPPAPSPASAYKGQKANHFAPRAAPHSAAVAPCTPVHTKVVVADEQHVRRVPFPHQPR